MIYVDVKGNLGNQMFEYACARALQEKTGQTICLNTCFLNQYKPEYKLSLQDLCLNDNVVIETEKRLPWYVNTYEGIVRALKGAFPKMYFDVMKQFGIYIWMKESFIVLPQKKHKDYYMVGYWQSTKYFEDIDTVIRKEFMPKYPLKAENQDLYDIIKNTESVCITIRRGDYVTNEKYKKEFFICDNDYFLKGVEKIKSEITDATIIVFSDDIVWVKDNVPFEGRVYYESGNDPVWEKIRLMSACKHFVISNSTFSWWVQHLSSNPNKIVYAPSKWFPNGRKCDIYEENWRYIDV